MQVWKDQKKEVGQLRSHTGTKQYLHNIQIKEKMQLNKVLMFPINVAKIAFKNSEISILS